MNSGPAPDEFDRARGVNTSGRMSPLWMGRSPAQSVGYGAVDPGDFKLAMQGLPVGAAAMPFVDMGCGKGRAMILAFEMGYQRLIGVDLSARLCRIGRKNFRLIARRWSQYFPPNAEFHACDATRFEFPAEPCVVFMFNPFGAETMRAMVRNIPTGSYIVYVNPRHDEALEGETELVVRGVYSTIRLKR